ncbi:MAG: hypothetical protein K0R93_664 [Anaerosolibacter sp.]|jgi:site-specific DNA recombinase|uniref:recombinase family protein n=1 Tax=Anaerosolibacter sp. TaxID=1872527 RepID=UPI00260C3223|nr:recombinase family protein [Anaerosolibacter sp.]MDF2545766.1 hypothetical protein [Anaerosolibacter sp.]
MATAGIYVRKSKATDKGESIENQTKRGISLCEMRGWDYIVYEDYDFSGKTLDRPDFERMMRDAKNRKIDYIICYKLDRISRSVNDFSSLVEELDGLGVGFICIKDNFDTTSPMGRAMMYITAVFAQLERETIAERVRDNMIDRAKMGKWNGGPVPFAFDVHKEVTDNYGRNKKVSKLIINNEESAIVREFYDWFLESDGSIRNVTFRANDPLNNYQTKNNSSWSTSQMARILQNPLYCIADLDAYEYFKNHTKVQIVNSKNDFDGTHGLMFYNRRKPHNKTTRERNEDEWILVIGDHEGFIPGKVFTKVQHKLLQNQSTPPRLGKSAISPLTGLVRCGRCNSSMSIFTSKKTTDDSKGKFRYYRCLTKEQRSKVLCDNTNIRADLLEEMIVKHISGLCSNKEFITELLESSNDDLDNKRVPLIAQRSKYQSELENIDKEMKNLVIALGKGTLPEIIIQGRFKELEDQKKAIKKQLLEVAAELDANYEETYNIDTFMKYIEQFDDTYEYLPFEDKKRLLRSIVKEVLVDKENITLSLYFLPTQNLNSVEVCSRMHKGSY